MAITADLVKKLREQTGIGMMDCKKALTETDGDFEKAVALLREKGLKVAAKRESKSASEGLIGCCVSEDGKTGALVEANCETSFVAKADDFVAMAKTLAKQAVDEDVACKDCLLSKPYAGNTSLTVADYVQELMGKIGEKLAVTRVGKLSVSGAGCVGSYTHMGDQIAVLVALGCESDDAAKTDAVKNLAKDIAMHISWSTPQYLTRDEIPAEVYEAEKTVQVNKALAEGKPANIVEKMVEGRMVKEFFARVCLGDQSFIKDESMTIDKLIKSVSKEVGEKIAVQSYVRFQVGETSGDK